MQSTTSKLNSWQSLSADELKQFLSRLSPQEKANLNYQWPFWARTEQIPPEGNWQNWLLLAGRGFGKSRTGAEYVRSRIEAGTAKRVALVAPIAADIRDVLVEGPAGILNITPPWNRPIYQPSRRHRLVWPNGAVAFGYSADEPERLRGPQHDLAWCDELAAWRYPETFDMLMFGLRLGSDPRCVITTTPKPTKLLREMINDPHTVVTRGTTYDNRANLAEKFFSDIIRKYEGTRLGRQELRAELLTDVPGALWTHAQIDELRLKQRDMPELIRVVVAIDPAMTSGEESDETGIIVAGKDRHGRGYVLDDLSGRYQPTEWARIAIAAYREHHADRIVAEINAGGELVGAVLRMINPNIPYLGVHAPATRGKVTRAEPVAALYEQRRVYHVGAFPQLEDQMAEFTIDFDRVKSGYSPDRVDALVWALTELLVDERDVPIVTPLVMVTKRPRIIGR